MTTHILISGRVQGVGFRYFLKKNADTLNIKGWARNLPDGRVEAFFDGSESALKLMLERCNKGPRAAVVTEIKFLKNAETERPVGDSFVILQ